MSQDWIQAISLENLKSTGRAVVGLSGQKIALFWHEGEAFACDNRCPHEGYPLSEGQLSTGGLEVLNGQSNDGQGDESGEKQQACLLTCNWHNWKFDLRDGSNLFGGDELRTYATKEQGGSIWVDLAAPPQQVQRAKACDRLLTAITYNDYPLIARELVRASQAGVSLEQALVLGLKHAHARLAFGTSHAFAGLSDWLSLRAERTDPAERLACLVEPLAHMAGDTLRHPLYPYAEFAKAGTLEELSAAIEAENESLAVGILRHLIKEKVCSGALQKTLSHAALRHYGDLGHSLIFVEKTFVAIQLLGEESQLALLLPLVRTLVFATREELLPAFRDYASALEAFQEPLPGGDAGALADYIEFGTQRALTETVARRGQVAESTWLSLYEAACERVYRFDVRVMLRSDGPVADNASWLTVTHGITFAAAALSTCRKYPELWPQALLQMACMVGRNVGYRDTRLLEPTPLRADDVFAQCFERILDHGEVEPVASVHLLKTATAARALWREGFRPPTLLAGLQRYFSIPLRRRHVLRTSRQSMALVGSFVEQE